MKNRLLKIIALIESAVMFISLACIDSRAVRHLSQSDCLAPHMGLVSVAVDKKQGVVPEVARIYPASFADSLELSSVFAFAPACVKELESALCARENLVFQNLSSVSSGDLALDQWLFRLGYLREMNKTKMYAALKWYLTNPSLIGCAEDDLKYFRRMLFSVFTDTAEAESFISDYLDFDIDSDSLYCVGRSYSIRFSAVLSALENFDGAAYKEIGSELSRTGIPLYMKRSRIKGRVLELRKNINDLFWEQTTVSEFIVKLRRFEFPGVAAEDILSKLEVLKIDNSGVDECFLELADETVSFGALDVAQKDAREQLNNLILNLYSLSGVDDIKPGSAPARLRTFLMRERSVARKQNYLSSRKDACLFDRYWDTKNLLGAALSNTSFFEAGQNIDHLLHSSYMSLLSLSYPKLEERLYDGVFGTLSRVELLDVLGVEHLRIWHLDSTPRVFYRHLLALLERSDSEGYQEFWRFLRDSGDIEKFKELTGLSVPDILSDSDKKSESAPVAANNVDVENDRGGPQELDDEEVNTAGQVHEIDKPQDESEEEESEEIPFGSKRNLWAAVIFIAVLEVFHELVLPFLASSVPFFSLPIIPLAINFIGIVFYIILGWDLVTEVLSDLWNQIKTLVQTRDIRSLNFNLETLIGLGSLVLFFLGNYLEAAAVLAFDEVGGLIEEWGESYAAEEIKKRLVDETVSEIKVLRAGEELFLLPGDIQAGDIINLAAGDKVPCDCVVVWGSGQLNKALITGESTPEHVSIDSRVPGGTHLIHGCLRAKVQVRPKESTMHRIRDFIDAANARKPAIARLTDRIANWWIPSALIITIFTAVVFGFSQAVAVLMVACPCAVLLAVPGAVSFGLGRAALMGIFVKDVSLFDKVHKADVVIFDKTGTLTEQQQVTAVHSVGLLSEDDVLSIAEQMERSSNHPLARGIVRAWEEKGQSHRIAVGGSSWDSEQEILRAGEYYIGTKAAVERIGLSLNGAAGAIEELETVGAKVVVVGHEVNGLIGYIVLKEEVKPDAAGFIRRLKNRGKTVYMLTGDSRRRALPVAEEVGIDRENVIAEVKESRKLETVKRLQAEGLSVLMLGDGQNDARALSRADVGIAVGDASEMVLDAADVFLADGDLGRISKLFKLSRRVYSMARFNLLFSFGYIGVMIVFSWFGLISPIAGAVLHQVSAAVVVCFSMTMFVPAAVMRFLKDWFSNRREQKKARADDSVFERSIALEEIEQCGDIIDFNLEVLGRCA